MKQLHPASSIQRPAQQFLKKMRAMKTNWQQLCDRQLCTYQQIDRCSELHFHTLADSEYPPKQPADSLLEFSYLHPCYLYAGVGATDTLQQAAPPTHIEDILAAEVQFAVRYPAWLFSQSTYMPHITNLVPRCHIHCPASTLPGLGAGGMTRVVVWAGCDQTQRYWCSLPTITACTAPTARVWQWGWSVRPRYSLTRSQHDDKQVGYAYEVRILIGYFRKGRNLLTL